MTSESECAVFQAGFPLFHSFTPSLVFCSELVGRARWVKRDFALTAEEREFRRREEKDKEKEIEREKQLSRLEHAKERQQAKEAAKEAAASKQVRKEWTPEMIEQRVMLLVATRGRRGTTPAEHVRAMAEMAVRARCLAQSRPDIYPQTRVIPVIMQLIAARVSFASLVHNGFSRPHDGVFPQFDSVLRNMDASLTRNEWRTAVHELNEVLDILNANPTYVLGNVKGEELANLAMRHKVSGQDEEEEGEGQEEKGGEETAHTMGGGSASLSLENIKKLAGVGDSLMKGEDGETAQLSSTEQLSDGRTVSVDSAISTGFQLLRWCLFFPLCSLDDSRGGRCVPHLLPPRCGLREEPAQARPLLHAIH